MNYKYISQEKATKYENLDIEQFTQKENFEEAAIKLLDGRKILKGETARQDFRFEYDEILEEVEEIRSYEIDELKQLVPETWDFISSVNGSVVFKKMKKGHLTDGLHVDSNVQKAIEKIKSNPILDEQQKEYRIKLRQNMQKEINEFTVKKNEKWTQDLVWKVWQVAQGEKAYQNQVDTKGEELAKKYVEKCRAIGLDKLNKIAEALYEEEEE